MHDIGKIGVQGHNHVLKIEELESDDRRAYESHPVRGQAAIDVVKGLRDAGVLIRYHHERFDGSGFPQGLKGENIPLGARIIAVADVLEVAVRTNPLMEPMAAVRRCLAGASGTYLDPALTLVAQGPAKKVFGAGEARKGWIKMNIDPANLRTGMVLTSDMRSGTGLLLLKRGSALNIERIEAIHRFYDLDPGLPSIAVLVEEKG